MSWRKPAVTASSSSSSAAASIVARSRAKIKARENENREKSKKEEEEEDESSSSSSTLDEEAVKEIEREAEREKERLMAAESTPRKNAADDLASYLKELGEEGEIKDEKTDEDLSPPSSASHTPSQSPSVSANHSRSPSDFSLDSGEDVKSVSSLDSEERRGKGTMPKRRRTINLSFKRVRTLFCLSPLPSASFSTRCLFHSFLSFCSLSHSFLVQILTKYARSHPLHVK